MKDFPEVVTLKMIDRLVKAEFELLRCKPTGKPQYDFPSAWSAFLIHCGGFLSILENGCKATTGLKAWHGQIVGERRKSEFLKYMNAARNVEEHGTEVASEVGDISKLDGKGIILTVTDPTVSGIRWGPNGFQFAPEIEAQLEVAGIAVELKQGVPRLLDVVDDRYHTTFRVPADFKGENLSPDNPYRFGELYLDYLRDLVEKIP